LAPPRPNRRPLIARVLPFACFIVLIAVSGLFGPPELPQEGAMDTRWLFVARGLLAGMLLAWFWREYAELRLDGWPPARDVALALGAGVFVFVAWINLDAPWMTLGSSPGFQPLRADGGLDWPLVAVRLAVLVIIVPVMEELFWRSFLLRWITDPDFLKVAPREVDARSFAITAGLFALEHELWLAGLLAGVVYNWIYVRSGSVWMVILAHAVTNGLLGWYILRNAAWSLW